VTERYATLQCHGDRMVPPKTPFLLGKLSLPLPLLTDALPVELPNVLPSSENRSEMPQGIVCWRRSEGNICPSNKWQLQCGGIIPEVFGLLPTLPDPAPHPAQPKLQGSTSPSL